MDAVDVDAAVVHNGHDVASAGADGCRGDGLVVGAHVKEQLTCVDVDEAHHSVLTEHAQSLSGRKLKTLKPCQESG